MGVSKSNKWLGSGYKVIIANKLCKERLRRHFEELGKIGFESE
ncbi:MAG: hypothetical protein PWQ37_254 [Candidatus Petromonas sp.]|jgi:hypothetical protein|nr:hypothetical protein [Candidatus Petromonas sp.]